jgi:uncharacterized small protein (DUF1192 family)
MKMFSPFPGAPGEKPRGDAPAATEETPSEATLDELRERINILQQQVERLSKSRKE